jgi:hypothetical protein
MNLRSLKFSLVLCGILLTVTLGLAWHNHRSMAIAEARHAKLASAARLAGISVDDSALTSTRQKTKRDRPVHAVDVNQLISFIRTFMKLQEASEVSTEEQASFVRSMEEICLMSLEQLEFAIGDIRATPGLTDEERSQIILQLVGISAQEHPEYLLQSLATVPEVQENLLKEKEDLIPMAFQPWLRKDPAAAAGWAKKNLDSLSAYNRLSVIRENAKQDPILALKLIEELQLEDPFAGYGAILGRSQPEAGEQALAAARQSLATLPDEKSKTAAETELFYDLASKLAKEKYEAGRKWIEAVKLSPTEVEIVGMDMAKSTKLENTSQWIEWIGSQLPPEQASAPVAAMMRNWTSNDYQAAGNWLSTTPDGPTKNAAIRAYAETVAKADPEVAKQWALTLPPGPEREDTLKSIQVK